MPFLHEAIFPHYFQYIGQTNLKTNHPSDDKKRWQDLHMCAMAVAICEPDLEMFASFFAISALVPQIIKVNKFRF